MASPRPHRQGLSAGGARWRQDIMDQTPAGVAPARPRPKMYMQRPPKDTAKPHLLRLR